MKKIIMAGLACTLAFSLVGCNESEKDPEIKKDKVEEKTESEESALLTNYDVVSEGYSFDITPTNDPYLMDGYIVKQNGLFGFISPTGEYIAQPEYECFYINYMDSAIESNNYIYMFRDKNEVNVTSGEALAYYLGYTDDIVCGTGIGGIPGLTFLDKNNNIMWFLPNIIDYPHLSEVGERFVGNKMLIPKIYEDYTEESLIDYSFKDWYIVTKDKNTLETKTFGPYTEGETCYFRTSEWDQDFKSIEIENPLSLFSHGMFYEHADGGYKIWNETGDAFYEEIVDSVTPLSFNAMKIEKDGKMGVVDSNLNLVLYGDFEDVTLPIDGHAFVKMDGSWKLIELK